MLIAGIPGAGKSTFGRWLADEHNLDHIDLDREPYRLDPTTWAPRTVLDWGFLLATLPFVRSLVADGVEHWWFDGDRDAAHESFGSRKDHPGNEGAWRIQLAAVEEHWDEIAALFAGRIIDVISAGPTYVSNEERLAEMQRRGFRVSS